MNKIKNTESQLKALIQSLLSKIEKDQYLIIPREKNNSFIRQYRLNNKKIKEILLCISVDNFESEEFDNETTKYGLGNVVIFIVKYEMVDIHGNTKIVRIYIKIKDVDQELPVISFHESER